MYSHAISLFLVGSLCGVPAVFAQDFDFSNLGGGGFGGGECKPHICGKGKSAVQKRPLKLESSGCQGLGGGMQMFNAGGSSDSGALGSCCDARHACTQARAVRLECLLRVGGSVGSGLSRPTRVESSASRRYLGSRDNA
jgi:hypothetical protein